MKIPARLQVLVGEGLIDHVLRQLKSGKEAEVYVVACGDQVRAAKIYKASDQRSFRQAVDYTENRKVKNSRQARAMAKGTRFGKAQREAAWLVRAAERRRESIARLLALVIEAQGPFLRGERPRPQRLAVATLADELGFHASTVRRLVEGKRLRVNGREIDLAELVG